MKHVLLAIFVFFASMPSQASCSDMHQSPDTPPGQHSDTMNHANMGHGDMEMDMDCCDHDLMDSTGNCDQVSHCRAPASGFVTIDTSPLSEVFINRQHHVATDATPATSRFDSPPFRPPIA